MRNLSLALLSAVVLSGCALTRAECDAKLYDARERCLRALDAQQRSEAERAKAKRANQKPLILRKDEAAAGTRDPRVP